MKLLVVGSGGREHALTWAFSRSPEVKQIYSNSTNAGILSLAKPVSASSKEDLARFAADQSIDLTIVGPEQPLVDGIVDLFESKGLRIFGPSMAAARLEGSKIFSKQFITRHRIPTARSAAFDDPSAALEAVRKGELGLPLVIKADGLAAGKGVIIAADLREAGDAIRSFMVDGKLGDAGDRVLLEECMTGRELSYLIVSDGEAFLPLPVAQDHKRAFDGDRGPNTGGMGVFSAPGMLDSATEQAIVNDVVLPTLAGARAEGFPIRGVLFIGLMLTADGPRVLEYNVRLGDPETQAVLPRLDSDLLEIITAAVENRLDCITARWSQDAVTTVVMASGGYPGGYQTGKPISGIEVAETVAGVEVFHAGTRREADGSVVTAGGRVLSVSARAKTLELATRSAYQAVDKISFEGAFYRRDIGVVG